MSETHFVPKSHLNPPVRYDVAQCVMDVRDLIWMDEVAVALQLAAHPILVQEHAGG